MKTSSLSLLVTAVCALSALLALRAQADGSLSLLPHGDSTDPVYELPLKWNERTTPVVSVPFRNESVNPLKVLGVQATSDIFISDFPATLESGKEARISFVYVAADNTEGDTDLIRVLTDQGIREIVIRLVREKVVQIDTRRLIWTVGETAEFKSVSITVAGHQTMPKAVRTTKDNSASIEFPAAGHYLIKVRPASTTEPHTFPVFVDFDPALPGGAVVLTCVVEKK